MVGGAVVGGGETGAGYRLEGGVEHRGDRLVLYVEVYRNDEVMNAVEEHIELTSVPKTLLEGGGVKPSERVVEGAGGDVVTEKHALHEAVKAGDINGVRGMLAGGVDVNGRDGRSWTGLMHAASRGYTLVVEELLRAEADAGLRAADGATALYMAAESGHLEIVRMLLEAGADTGVMGPRGRRATDVAEEGGYAEVVALLKAVEAERALQAREAWEKELELRERGLGLKHSELVLIQRGLVSLGKRVGGVDGVFGDRTRRAIGEWQGEKGLDVTGYLTGDQARALKALGEAAERAEAERRARLEREAEARRQAELERERREREAAERERVRLAREAAERRAREAEARRQAELERERRAREAAERERLAREAREAAERKARAEREPGREFQDCAECPWMVVVPAGEYWIGSPEGEAEGEGSLFGTEYPRHRVRIGDVFAVGKYEVTRGEYGEFVRETGRDMSGECWMVEPPRVYRRRNSLSQATMACSWDC